MHENRAKLSDPAVELPAAAPLVRITAGAGSAGQKTWNLRRPVTLIGSRRPAHIVLHDREISKAHCVIVNTGSDVLLKDLHTSGGTQCNNKAIDLIMLKDGDVINVGGMRIQVAIQVPADLNDDSACGMAYVDPAKFPKPIELYLEHTETRWRVEDAVALIGRHDHAGVRIDHPDVASRQAVLFRFGDGAAAFDLGCRNGLSVNGHLCSLVVLRGTDRIGVGPCTLFLERPQPSTGDQSGPVTADSAEPNSRVAPESTPLGSNPSSAGGTSSERIGETQQATRSQTPDAGALTDRAPPTSDKLTHIETELSSLQTDIANSWERLNEWEARLRENADKLSSQQQNLEARAAELDARDAALRGQLHDLTRYNEQISGREQELAALLENIRVEQEKMEVARVEGNKRDADLARRGEELPRREHVLAQRWARLQSATCPHCGESVRTGSADAAA